MTRAFTAILTLSLLTGCLDSDEFASDVQCDDRGLCWTMREDWPAWAQTIQAEDLQADLAAGTLTPVDYALPGTDCYEIVGGPVFACVTELDGLPVLGMPMVQLGPTLVASNCAPGGPWDFTLERHEGQPPRCFAHVNGLAVLLDTSR